MGAGILPAALGTQVVGSTLRPASYCGCVGFKPTFGALNRSGSFDHLSQSCLGIMAATPEDVWTVASAIVSRVGGDPGHGGLRGPSEMPAARVPRRLAVLETAAWPQASAGAQAAFAGTRVRLAELGVMLEDRRSDPDIAAVEDTIADAVAVTFRIFDWEFRWPLGNYAKRNGLSDGMRRRLASAQQMTLDDYRRALRRRQEVRERYARGERELRWIRDAGCNGGGAGGPILHRRPCLQCAGIAPWRSGDLVAVPERRAYAAGLADHRPRG